MPISKEEIIETLKKFDAPRAYYFDELGSTMDVAKELAQDLNKYPENKIYDGAADRLLIIASAQTAGRGQAGREWFSPNEGGLYFTFADLKPKKVEQTLGLSLSVGASICESLKNINVAVGLKWPNDIIYFPMTVKEPKKVGGILIEAVISGSETKAIFIGVGINVSTAEFPADVPGISIATIANREIEIAQAFETIISSLSKDIQTFFDKGFIAFKNLWRKHSLMFGTKMSMKTEDGKVECIIDDIADDGALLVKINDEVKTVYSAEFSFIGNQKNLTISQTIDQYVANYFTEIPEEEKQEILESLNAPIEEEVEDLLNEDEYSGSKNINAVIKDLKLGQKIKLAMLGNMGARGILIRENSRQIRQAVMKNPRLTENEVWEFAKNANLDKHVFQLIGNDNNWMRSYPIQVAIVSNPKTPMEISMRWIKYLKDKELKDLSKSKNIPGTLTSQIRKLLETRTKKPGGSGH